MEKTLIIGDIHGCADELDALLDIAGVGDDDWIVSVGDLIDRGPAPGRVLDLFRHRPRALAVSGNHERKHVRGPLSPSQRLAQAQLGARYADDVAWMATLPYHLERPDVRVVHFGCVPGQPLGETPEEVRAGTIGGTKRLDRLLGAPWWTRYTDDIPIVFGHHVFDRPLVVDDRVFGIDTGCVFGRRLTGLLLPERRLVSVPARADHWRAARGAVGG